MGREEKWRGRKRERNTMHENNTTQRVWKEINKEKERDWGKKKKKKKKKKKIFKPKKKKKKKKTAKEHL